MTVIDGKKIAAGIEQKIQKAVAEIKGRKPGLAFIRIGEDMGAKIYIQRKKQKCKEVGICSFDYELPSTTSEKEAKDLIQRLNQDKNVDGILLQLPLPPHLNPLLLIEEILPQKDVDGFHPVNMGKLLLGDPTGFIPCTPMGIHHLLVETGIPLSGKHVVIVGRSNIVGKPLAALLMQKKPSCNATITVANASTHNLTEICKQADILIAATGKPNLITEEKVKKGAVVIDVGINRLPSSDSKKTVLVGDVDFEKVAPLTSFITPVPGGVGPMTIAYLLSNTLKSYTG